MHPNSSRRKRTVFLNLALATLSILFTLAALEAFFRVVAPPPRAYALPRDLLYYAEAGVWTLRPNLKGVMDNRVDFTNKTVTVDSRGVRVTPAAIGRNDHPRLFFLGDSQTFGHGLSDDETWANHLQRQLLQSGKEWTVENWGIPGINIDQYVVRSRFLLPVAKSGDALVVGVTWNDLITQPYADQVMSVINGYLVSEESGKNIDQARRLIDIYEHFGVVVPPFQNMKVFLDAMSYNSALVAFLYPRIKAVYYRYRAVNPVSTFVNGGVIDANFWLLNDIKRSAQAAGLRFAVLLLPERQFFEDTAYKVYSVNGRDFPTQNYMAYLAMPLCEKLDIVCIDAFDILHAHQNDPIAFRVDGHYNEKGAALLGAYFAEKLAPVLDAP